MTKPTKEKRTLTQTAQWFVTGMGRDHKQIYREMFWIGAISAGLMLKMHLFAVLVNHFR